MTTRSLLSTTAQMHNDLQDLAFALEYDEQGVHQRVPERVQEYLGSLMRKNSELRTKLEGMMQHETTS